MVIVTVNTTAYSKTKLYKAVKLFSLQFVV